MNKFYLLFIVFLFLLHSCSTTSHLPATQYLLKKNEVVINSPLKLATKNISPSEILAIVRPSENKQILGFLKIFGIRFKYKLMIYNACSGGKLNPVKGWFQENLGEHYFVYDSILIRRSVYQIEDYLFNNGYYDATVSYEIKKKGRKASVKYIIKPKTQFIINNVFIHSQDSAIGKLINDNKGLSLIKFGAPFSSLTLSAERERIELLLRNNGYYNFSQQYVYYTLDSAIVATKKSNVLKNLFTETNRPVNINMMISNPESGLHQRFTVNHVLIYPDFKTDTLMRYTSSDSIIINQYQFILKRFTIKPGALLDNIFIIPNHEYSLDKHQLTAARLGALGIYKTVNIQFVQTSINTLNCYVYLVASKKRESSAEVQASTNSDFIGGGVNFNYKSKNIFKTGDIFSLSTKGSLESPFENTNKAFNVLDIGGQASIQFPRFMLPFKTKSSSPYENAKTKISASFNYLSRKNYYTQNQTNFSFGYDWNESRKKHHYLNPLVLSFVSYPEKSNAFNDILNRNPLLIGSFQSQLIPGMNYTFTYTSLNPNAQKRSIYYLKIFADVAGNLSMLAINTTKHNAPYKLFGNELSQFAKLDIENRLNVKIANRQNLVFRTATGIGKAYGNSTILPYVKQFYAGGPNGMRGFRARTVGPGAYRYNKKYVDTFENETGDIRLEANLEYRFHLWWYLNGAVFSDIGNVWLMKADKLRPNANFDIHKFYQQFAVDAGIGIRFDYKSYFLLRFDVGFPMVQPYEQKWLGDDILLRSSSWRSHNLKYNLAVGYPF
ncbi:MAG: hypothetical protein RIQ33_1968 [Bacteroidota bacterium]|jgi:outer membrane protein assembly factor BamA